MRTWVTYTPEILRGKCIFCPSAVWAKQSPLPTPSTPHPSPAPPTLHPLSNHTYLASTPSWRRVQKQWERKESFSSWWFVPHGIYCLENYPLVNCWFREVHCMLFISLLVMTPVLFCLTSPSTSLHQKNQYLGHYRMRKQSFWMMMRSTVIFKVRSGRQFYSGGGALITLQPWGHMPYPCGIPNNRTS